MQEIKTRLRRGLRGRRSGLLAAGHSKTAQVGVQHASEGHYTISYYIMLYHTISCRNRPCHTTSYNNRTCCTILYCIIVYCTILSYLIWCFVVVYYDVLCYTTFHTSIPDRQDSFLALRSDSFRASGFHLECRFRFCFCHVDLVVDRISTSNCVAPLHKSRADLVFASTKV